MIIMICLANVTGLILCYLDKQRAIHHQDRIPEAVFFFLGFIGGAFLILLGMHLFHHKTRKGPFKAVIYCDLFISLILCYEAAISYIG